MDQNQNNFDPSSSVPPHWSIQYLNHDPEQPMMPTDQMPQLDQSSSFPPYSQTDHVAVFQQSSMTIMPPPPPQNQSIRIENNDNSSRPRGYKTEAEMMTENYLEEYSRSIDPQDESDLLNFDSVPMNFSERRMDLLNFKNTEITGGHSNSNNDTAQFFTPSSFQSNFSAPAPTPTPAPAPIEGTGCLSDVVNCCFGRMRPAPVNSLPREPPLRRGGAATKGGASSSRTAKNWSENEHNLFLVGMEIFGKGDWKNIAGKVVITKTHTQVASHAQKYFGRQQSSREDRKRSSIHDINTVDPILLLQVCIRLGRLPATTTTMNYPPVLLQHFRPTDHQGLP